MLPQPFLDKLETLPVQPGCYLFKDKKGEVVYVGDGYSDRCAAEDSDRVFATRGLAEYLDERGIPYERFDDFHDVARGLAS